MSLPTPFLPPGLSQVHSTTPQLPLQNQHPHYDACALAARLAAELFGIPLPELTASTRRTRAAALARQAAMYVAHVVFGLTYTEVGQCFGRDRTTAAYACRLVEDRRDDAAFDQRVAGLEQRLRAFSLQCKEGGRS